LGTVSAKPQMIGTHMILASQSPRRLELMQSMGIDPQVMPADIDET